MCDEDTLPEALEEEECVCTPKEPKVAKKAVPEKFPCTCPYDPRFPNTNQTRRCVVNFIDYHRCTRLLGDYQGCRIFKVCYTALCPMSWIDRWHEQMEEGVYPHCKQLPKQETKVFPDESEPFDTAGY